MVVLRSGWAVHNFNEDILNQILTKATPHYNRKSFAAIAREKLEPYGARLGVEDTGHFFIKFESEEQLTYFLLKWS